MLPIEKVEKCSKSNSLKGLEQYLWSTKHNYTPLQTVSPLGRIIRRTLFK